MPKKDDTPPPGFKVGGKSGRGAGDPNGWTVERRRDTHADSPVRRGLRGFLRKRGKK